ncbi:MAG: ester cyclase [Parvularculaceae bacterium]|nr:ester cyclase [Parvularculaceae bacterium]
MTDAELGARRLRIVREHMEAENQLDFDAAIETFDRPRYELVGTGQTFDGESEVREYYRASREAFPDQRNEIVSLRSAGDAVVTEFWLLGTHEGPLKTPGGELAPTGKTFRIKMVAIFEFAGEKIAAERIYFDRMSLLQQLTGG